MTSRVLSKKTSQTSSTEKQAPERIQKLLATLGYGSRREIESWIAEGRIEVNGKTAVLGDKASRLDRIALDGKRIRMPSKVGKNKKSEVLLYHKNDGEICSRRDPEGRPTVFDKLPKRLTSRWVMVGRLDFNTQGLLLFTTDGELAKRLMHPSYQIEREYAVRVSGELSSEQVIQLQKGIQLSDGPARFKKINYAGGDGKNRWYNVILTEGRNREVRRLFEAVGFTVSRLIRTRYGDIHLPRDLKRGKHQLLETKTVQTLLEKVEL